MEGILSVELLVDRHVVTHLLLDSVVGIFVETLNDRSFVLNDSHLGRLPVDLGLESEGIELLLLTFHAELLEFFILLFLEI